MGSSGADLLSTVNVDQSNEQETPVYEKYDALLHGKSRSRHEQILSVQFMRKYIQLAKCLKPKLTESASEVIANEYSRLRSHDSVESDVARTQPVTARTLETLIRLSTAHAKARMGKSVTVNDAQAAIELVQYAYFKKVLEKEKKKRRRDSGISEEDDETEMETDSNAPSNGTTTRSDESRRKRTRIDVN